MRILILPKYTRRAASTRYRFLQYLPRLRTAGIECDVAPLFDDDYLQHRFTTGRPPARAVLSGYIRRLQRLRSAGTHDLLVVYFELFPYVPRWFEQLVTPPGIPYVLDLDDAIFLNYEARPGAALRWLAGDKMSHVFGGATLVMAGNEFLAERARRDAKWVEVVPTVVDTGKYLPRQPSDSPERFTVGWIGSPSTAPFLRLVADPLLELSRIDGVRVLVIGAGNLQLSGVQLETREWSEATEVDDIGEFDVGIMPLPDTAWSRGKCGFKLIQCMARGVPVVASPVGVNSSLVEHGVNGFLARTSDEWREHLSRLRDDPGLRVRMGMEGRRKIEREYSLRAWAPRVESLWRQAARNAGPAC